MPTRLVLKETVTAAKTGGSSVVSGASGNSAVRTSLSAAVRTAQPSPPSPPETARPLRTPPTTPRTPPPRGNLSGTTETIRRNSSVILSRKSILRELSVRRDHRIDHHDDEDNDNNNNNDDDNDDDDAVQDRIRLSTDDIRASPRLLGYLFGSIASAVMLVSVVKFYYSNILHPDPKFDAINAETLASAQQNAAAGQLDKLYIIPNGFVTKWKLWGSIYISAASTFLNLVTCIVHFDTFFVPKRWQIIFRDGSLWERNWIVLLLLVAAAGVHVCTSSLSVGQFQANVFFTTWIAFAAAASNFSVWRESAGLLPYTEQLHNCGRKRQLHLQQMRRAENRFSRRQIQQTSSLNHDNEDEHGHYRQTTDNWMWTAFFSAVFCGSITDMYLNRAELGLMISLESLKQSGLQAYSHEWEIILGVVWAEFAVCLLAILINECFVKTSWILPCSCHVRGERYRVMFGWRQIEGLVILVSIGGKLWVIIKYTGVDAVINGLNNAYFGVWGSFFNSAFALGTWINEKKNIAYMFIKEGCEDYDETER